MTPVSRARSLSHSLLFLFSAQPQHRSALSIGFLIGVSFMMCQLLLIVAAVSGANLANVGNTVEEMSSGSKAVTTFASLLLLAQIAFTTFVTMFRDTLLPAGSMASTDTALPPPSFGGPSAYESSSASYDASVSVQPMPPPPGGGGVL